MSGAIGLIDIVPLSHESSTPSSIQTTLIHVPSYREEDLQRSLAQPAAAQDAPNTLLFKRKAAITMVVQLTVVFSMNSLVNGIVTIGIPQIAEDLDISEALINWYLSQVPKPPSHDVDRS